MNDKEKILAAINKLLKLDTNFAENLAKLAEIAEKKPMVYKQAVNMLKSY